MPIQVPVCLYFFDKDVVAPEIWYERAVTLDGPSGPACILTVISVSGQCSWVLSIRPLCNQTADV